MTRTNLALFATVFSLATIFSLAGIYFTNQTPVETDVKKPLLTYQQHAKYDYVAELKPNYIYNRTTIKPGEGTLYTAITKLLNIRFTYTFNCSVPSNITVQDDLTVFYRFHDWNKTLTVLPMETSTFRDSDAASFTRTQTINVTSIKMLQKQVELETALYGETYSVVFEPRIYVSADTAAGPVRETFTPNMNITLRHGTSLGDYITLEGLNQTRTGEISQTEHLYMRDVANQRYISYAATLVSVVGLTFTTRSYFRKKPPKAERAVDEAVKPYRDIIFDAEEEPPKKNATEVKVKTLEELVGVANTLGLPVIHVSNTESTAAGKVTHVFLVLDGSVRYMHQMKGESPAELNNPQESSAGNKEANGE